MRSEETGKTRQVSKELIMDEEIGGGNSRVIRKTDEIPGDIVKADSDKADKE